MVEELWRTYRRDLEDDPIGASSYALQLVQAGVPAADVAAEATGSRKSDVAYGIVQSAKRGVTAPVRELLEALISNGLDINEIDPEYSGEGGHLLSLATSSGNIDMVRFLLQHGAHPDLDRAEAAQNVIVGWPNWRDEGWRGRAVLTLLYRAGLSPTVLYLPQVRELYAGHELSLLPLGPNFWQRLGLPAAVRQGLRAGQAALTAAMGTNLARYIQQAL